MVGMSGGRAGWEISTWRGDAGVHHFRPVPEPFRRAVWIHEVARPALVLGSAQKPEVADAALADRLGVEVVRRRSGGGAVLLVPGDVAWLDVFLPVGDRLWDDDVSRSGLWLGEVWRAALDQVGVAAAQVHQGRLDPSPLGRVVCFGAVGPGEVTWQGRKLVGISQRRNRQGARFQCAVYRRWDPSLLVRLLHLEDGAAETLVGAASGSGVDPERMVHAFLERLPLD